MHPEKMPIDGTMYIREDCLPTTTKGIIKSAMKKAKNSFGFQVKMYEETNEPPYRTDWCWVITNTRGRDIMPVVSYNSKAGCKRMATKIAKSFGVELQEIKNN